MASGTTGDRVRRDVKYPRVFWVTSRNRPKEYRVEFHEFDGESYVTCTCIHGQNNQGSARCYHVVVARGALSEVQEDDAPRTGATQEDDEDVHLRGVR